QFLARFGGNFALGDVYATLEAPGFAFQRLQALDRAAHLVDQPLFLEWVEVDVANRERNLDARARHVPLGVNPRTLFGLWCFFQFGRLLQARVVQLRDLLDVLERLLRLVGNLFFGELFIVELDDFLDRTPTLAQIVAHRDQFLDDNRGARDRLHHH